MEPEPTLTERKRRRSEERQATEEQQFGNPARELVDTQGEVRTESDAPLGTRGETPAAGEEQRQANREKVRPRMDVDPQRRGVVFAHSCAGPTVPSYPKCVVPLCSARVAPSTLLYPLPVESPLRQAWIDFVRACPCGGARYWDPLPGEVSLVCSLHFTARCFWYQRPRACRGDWSLDVRGIRKCLRKGAVPTLYPVEEQGSLAASEGYADNTAEDLGSSDATDAQGHTSDSWASSRSFSEQDGGHHSRNQGAVQKRRRKARRPVFEVIFPKDASTQCSVETASKTVSYAVKTASKSVQCNG